MALALPLCEYIMHLYKRFFKEPKQSYFLFGPRGTGKSTLIKMRHPGALWIDLLLPDVLRTYLARPEYLIQILEGQPVNSTIVIDEVQKVPSLLTAVHAVIEQKKGHQFILTGSSSRKLKRTGADLMAGRALKKMLHPFIASEMNSNFRLQDALTLGMLPLLTDKENPKEVLESYVDLYLREEIQAEGLVRNLEAFTRFLEVVSFSHASLLNVTNIARECEVKRKTVENYLDILEELLLAYRLPVFLNRAQREMSAHPKFYLFDAGVFRTLRPRGPLDRPEEIEGAALEGLVAQHLLAWSDYSDSSYQIAFWRTRSGTEVDFVVYGENGFWAIEVKNSTKVQPQDLRGLEAFKKDYPMAKAIFLYRGADRFVQKDVLCIPCEEFLLGIKPNQPLS